jgi:hypothetical protein
MLNMNRGGRIEIPPEVIRMVNEQQLEEWQALLRKMSPVYDSDPRLPIARAIENEITRIKGELACQ